MIVVFLNFFFVIRDSKSVARTCLLQSDSLLIPCFGINKNMLCFLKYEIVRCCSLVLLKASCIRNFFWDFLHFNKQNFLKRF